MPRFKTGDKVKVLGGKDWIPPELSAAKGTVLELTEAGMIWEPTCKVQFGLPNLGIHEIDETWQEPAQPPQM